jgi:hypothetical protein
MMGYTYDDLKLVAQAAAEMAEHGCIATDTQMKLIDANLSFWFERDIWPQVQL